MQRMSLKESLKAFSKSYIPYSPIGFTFVKIRGLHTIFGDAPGKSGLVYRPRDDASKRAPPFLIIRTVIV